MIEINGSDLQCIKIKKSFIENNKIIQTKFEQELDNLKKYPDIIKLYKKLQLKEIVKKVKCHNEREISLIEKLN